MQKSKLNYFLNITYNKSEKKWISYDMESCFISY